MTKVLIYKIIWIFVIFNTDIYENRKHIHVGKRVTKKLSKTYPFLKQGTDLTCSFIEALEDDKQREICHQINRRTEFRVLSSDYREKFEK